MWQSTVLALALLLLLVRPVRAHFLWSRRTQTNEPAVTTATHPSSTTTTTSGSRRSRGTEGDTARVAVVHRHHPVTSKTNLPVDEVEHPDRYYVEHHPYASGVFAFDPNLEINCMH